MFVMQVVWDAVRDQYSQQEKDLMNLAIAGHVICPRGITLDPILLPPDLRDKIQDHIYTYKRLLTRKTGEDINEHQDSRIQTEVEEESTDIQPKESLAASIQEHDEHSSKTKTGHPRRRG